MSWLYNDKNIENIEEFPQGTIGFVYRITHIPTQKSYIGKKILHFTKKTKLGKKEMKLLKGGVGRPSTSKIVVKESDWLSYYSSNLEIKKLVKEGKSNDFERVILRCVPSKKLLSYYESKHQFLNDVLENPNWYNDNIAGKFYRKDFIDNMLED